MMEISTTSRHFRFVLQLYWYTLLFILVSSFLIEKGQEVLWINRQHSDFQDTFFKAITHLGEGWVFVPLIIYTLFLRFSLAFSITTMAVLHGVICSFFKRVLFVHADRPTALLNRGDLYLIPGVSFHEHFSFPSGHTATFVCFAVML